MKLKLFLVAVAALIMSVGGIVAPTPANAVAWANFSIDGPLYSGTSNFAHFTGGDSPTGSFTVNGFGTSQTQSTSTGTFTYKVSASTAPGSYYLSVTQGGQKVAEYWAYVNNAVPYVVATKYYLKVGETTALNGAYFLPGEQVALYVNGKDTGVRQEVGWSLVYEAGRNVQGLLFNDQLSYKIPSSLKGTTAEFDVRGLSSNHSAKAWITVAS